MDHDLGGRPRDGIGGVEVRVPGPLGGAVRARHLDEQVPVRPLAAVAQVQPHVLAERLDAVGVRGGVEEGLHPLDDVRGKATLHEHACLLVCRWTGVLGGHGRTLVRHA